MTVVEHKSFSFHLASSRSPKISSREQRMSHSQKSRCGNCHTAITERAGALGKPCDNLGKKVKTPAQPEPPQKVIFTALMPLWLLSLQVAAGRLVGGTGFALLKLTGGTVALLKRAER